MRCLRRGARRRRPGDKWPGDGLTKLGKQRNQFDSPWKEAIGLHFSPFLEFFFPKIYAKVNWKKGYQLLDKELAQVSRDANLGQRDADMLVRVTRKSGVEAWALLHVEIQSQVDKGFPLRMYVYNYRIFDKYAQEVVSLAILGVCFLERTDGIRGGESNALYHQHRADWHGKGS